MIIFNSFSVSSPEGNSHTQSHEKPPFSYGFPMVFPWFSYGFPMVFLWFSYGFPMVFPWFSYGFPMVFLWFSYGFPMVFPWFSHGFPMVFLWFSYGFPMVFLSNLPTSPRRLPQSSCHIFQLNGNHKGGLLIRHLPGFGTVNTWGYHGSRYIGKTYVGNIWVYLQTCTILMGIYGNICGICGISNYRHSNYI